MGDFEKIKVKDTRREFVPGRKVWKLHEDSVKSDFSSFINKYRESNQKYVSIEGYRNFVKGVLLEAAVRSCGWTKSQARHKKGWWWNDDVCNSVTEKRKLWKE